MVYVPSARVADIDPDLLIVALVRPELGDIPGGTLFPADVADRLGTVETGGYWVVRPILGGPAVDDRFAGSADLLVEAKAVGRARALWLCRRVMVVLRSAHRRQVTTPYGHVASLRFDLMPYEVREGVQPAGQWHYRAAGSLVLRPPV